MKVRVAQEQDLDALTGLVLAFRDHLGAADPTPEEIVAFLPEMLADPGCELCIAWADDEVPLGYASWRQFRSLWSVGWEAHLEDLFVVETARGAGVGAALLEHTVGHARERGCAGLGLHTNEGNLRAQEFYRHRGFRPASEARWEGGREVFWVRSLRGEREGDETE